MPKKNEMFRHDAFRCNLHIVSNEKARRILFLWQRRFKPLKWHPNFFSAHVRDCQKLECRYRILKCTRPYVHEPRVNRILLFHDTYTLQSLSFTFYSHKHTPEKKIPSQMELVVLMYAFDLFSNWILRVPIWIYFLHFFYCRRFTFICFTFFLLLHYKMQNL